MKNIVFQSFSIKNFLSIGDEPVQIQFNKGIHLITGINNDKDGRRNGVGKSAIMDSLHWILFGSPIRDISKSTISNFNTKGKCEGILEFEVGLNGKNTTYKIIRTLSPSKCLLFVNGEDKTLSSINSTNDLITQILGFSSILFRNSVILSINNTQPFLAQDKVTKRKFIEGVFNLEVFSHILSEVRQKALDIKKQIDILDAKIDSKKQNIIVFESQKKNFEEERKQKIDELKKDISISESKKEESSKKVIDVQSLLDKQSSLKEKKNHIQTAINENIYRINGCQVELRDLDNLNEKYNINKNELKELIDFKKSLEDKKHGLEVPEELDKLKEGLELQKNLKLVVQNEIEKLAKAKEAKTEIMWGTKQNINDVQKNKELYVESTKVSFCPTCKRRLDTKIELEETKIVDFDIKLKELNITLSNIDKEIKEQLDKEIENRNSWIKNYDIERAKLLENISRIEKIQIESRLLQKQLDDVCEKINILKRNDYDILIEHLLTRKQQFKQQIEESEIIKNRLQNEGLFLIEGELEKLNQKIIYNEKIKSEVEFISKQIEEYKKQIVSIENQKNTFVDLLENNEKEYNILQVEQKENQKLHAIYESAKFIVSEEGVKAYIIKKLLAVLNERIRYYLKKLDFNSTCSFNEFFEETIKNDKGIDCSYFNFSGAEMKAIDLACLFAFMDLRRLQGDVSINVSMYDELFDSSFDEKGLDHIIDILNERVDQNSEAIFVISHRKESLKAVTGEVVYLEKSNGITKRTFSN